MECTLSQNGKGILVYEGNGYRRDTVKLNRDGSISLRCVHRGCAGRIKKHVDETIDFITPHNHGSGVDAQYSKRGWSYEGYRYRHDRLNQDGSMSLRCIRRDCAGRMKKLVDGTTYCITPHSHVASQQGEEETLLHEGYHYQSGNGNCSSLMSLQTVDVTRSTDTSCTGTRSDVPQEGKVAWLYEGYHYRCDEINQDGSLSLRCIRHNCAGRIRKFLDGTTDYITPHSHESCSVVPNPVKEYDALLREACHYQLDKINEDSLLSLEDISVTENTPELCSETAISQQQKETWLHEGYRYRCVGVNRDGSLSLRCVRRGCAGRIKKHIDGTTISVTKHRHAVEAINFIKTDTESIEADIQESDENVLLQSMIGEGFEFDLPLPSYSSSQQTVKRKRKRDCVPDHETSTGVFEVIMLTPFSHCIIVFSTKCF